MAKEKEVTIKEEEKIVVQRSEFTSNNKKYFQYFVKGSVQGREKEIRLTCSGNDSGMFAVLDIIFEVEPKPTLVAVPFSMTANDGHEITGFTYEVVAEVGGIKYTAKVKPSRPSDKALLDILHQQNAIKVSEELPF